jgi:hypothetical protein
LRIPRVKTSDQLVDIDDDMRCQDEKPALIEDSLRPDPPP